MSIEPLGQKKRRSKKPLPQIVGHRKQNKAHRAINELIRLFVKPGSNEPLDDDNRLHLEQTLILGRILLGDEWARGVWP